MTIAKKTRKVSELKIIGRRPGARPPHHSYSAPAAVRTRPLKTERLERGRYTRLNLAQVKKSVLAEPPLHRLDQPCAVVADAVLEHDDDVLDVVDVRCRIPFDDDQVRVLARRN